MLKTASTFVSSALLALSVAAGATCSVDAHAAGGKRHHAISLLGTPAMPEGFSHFDWVDPAAPKGGTVRLFEMGTFDSLNGFTTRGSPADGLGDLYDTLMSSSPDEPSTEYCLVCEWVSYPDDVSSATFGLRAEARFHDGRPITVDDVIFSLQALKEANPQYAFYYKNVTGAEQTGEREVTFRFDQTGNRELPLIVGQIPVLPKHFWQGTGADGEPRDLKKTSLEVPLGSGPYRIKSFETGRTIVYERVADYWAKDLPVAKGQWNFGEIHYVYFRDRTPAFEAFKSGRLDMWQETSASAWATQYAVDAVKNGLILKEDLPHKRVAGMQSFAFNVRRPPFQDPRVRKAFNLAFDFESANKTLFYGAYTRLNSFFDNSELAARGLPEGREKEILEDVKDGLPPEVFTTEWRNPTADTPMDLRKNMREAVALLQAAGWTQKGGQLVDASGQPFTAEFLLVQPDFERIVLPFVENLRKLGIQASARVVDSSQYQRRVERFDFDLIVTSFGQSHSPGNEQRSFWGSEAADREGSRNVIGIKSPAIDQLIEKIVFARDRADLVAATRALDRVLLWSHYVVPQWYLAHDRIATWDMFGRPGKLPSQTASFLRVWWVDPAKAAALAGKRMN